ncbi:hypothetical protein OQA88_706 [Cercophora sp. LCS_1]
MAAPLVAGVCAILREALLVNHPNQRPSSALIKALLINGAASLREGSQTEQGFGRVDVNSSLAPVEAASSPNPNLLTGFADALNTGKLAEGKSWIQEIKVPATWKNVAAKATLAYTDRFGAAIQNKLSLSVQVASGSSTTEHKVNYGSENNVEQIALTNLGAASAIKITVKATRIARLDDAQGFAVVWSVIGGSA